MLHTEQGAMSASRSSTDVRTRSLLSRLDHRLSPANRFASAHATAAQRVTLHHSDRPRGRDARGQRYACARER